MSRARDLALARARARKHSAGMHRFGFATPALPNFFNPTYIPGMVAWFDSETNVTSLISVTAWGDKSGLGNNFTTIGGNPTKQSSVFKSGSKPSIRFDGSGDNFNTATSLHLGTTALAMAVVFKTSTTTSMDLIGIANGNAILKVNGGGSGTVRYTYWNGASNDFDAGSGLADGNAHSLILTHLQDGSGATSIHLYVDGVDNTSDNTANLMDGIQLGFGSFNGDVAEAVWWSELPQPTPAQIASLHSYFVTRWF